MIFDREEFDISEKDFKKLQRRIHRLSSRKIARKKNEILAWYGCNGAIAYWKALGNRDFNMLKKLCVCVNNLECPACKILRLKLI